MSDFQTVMEAYNRADVRCQHQGAMAYNRGMLNEDEPPEPSELYYDQNT